MTSSACVVYPVVPASKTFVIWECSFANLLYTSQTVSKEGSIVVPEAPRFAADSDPLVLPTEHPFIVTSQVDSSGSISTVGAWYVKPLCEWLVVPRSTRNRLPMFIFLLFCDAETDVQPFPSALFVINTTVGLVLHTIRLWFCVYGQSGSTSMVGRLLCNNVGGGCAYLLTFSKTTAKAQTITIGKEGVQLTHLQCPSRERSLDSTLGARSPDATSWSPPLYRSMWPLISVSLRPTSMFSRSCLVRLGIEKLPMIYGLGRKPEGSWE
ncbi:hypothetical protein B0J14DRAFT_597543 [Halenospora varia]|nr:hypothetical protein B0J14DRAFT_597543 [Halenospora varia]